MSRLQVLGWCVAGLTISIPISYFVAGWRSSAGISLGIFATSFGMIAWWFVTGLISSGAKRGVRPIAGSVLIVLAFLCKLPLFLAATYLSVKIGGAARTSFIAGLGLVYLCLVGVGLAHDVSRPR